MLVMKAIGVDKVKVCSSVHFLPGSMGLRRCWWWYGWWYIGRGPCVRAYRCMSRAAER